MSQVLDESGWLGPSEEYLDEKGKTAWKEDTDNPQPHQQQQQQLQKGQTDAITSKYTAGAPAGPDAAVTQGPGLPSASGGQPMGPSSVSSSSSYVSAFSGSSGVSSNTGSRSSSPGRLAVTPVGQIGGSSASRAVAAPGALVAGGGVVGPVPVTSTAAGGPGSPMAAAVAAATAATAAAKGGQQRGPFGAASSSTTSSSSSRDSSVHWPVGPSALNRHDSKSAPLLLQPLGQGSDLTFGSRPHSSAGPAAAVEPASPRSEAGSIASDTTEGGTVKISKRMKITKMLGLNR